MSAFGRAFHAENETHPVFNDFAAKNLMTDEEYEAVKKYILGGAKFFEPELDFGRVSEREVLRKIINDHIAPNPLCRSAWAESALKKSGVKRYVILGAGLDTFAFRDGGFLIGGEIFEVDHPLTQADKLRRIGRAGLKIPDNLRFVAVDFSKDDLAEKLKENGFDKSEKAFFSWLGVTYYLTKDEIENGVDKIASIAGKGSILAFDYPDENFFAATERRVKNTIMMAAAGGEPMKTSLSFDELKALLNKCGFAVKENLTPTDIQREIIDESGSDIKAFEHVNYCLAVFEGV